MNALNSSKGKNLSPNNKPALNPVSKRGVNSVEGKKAEPPVSWTARVDYMKIIQKTGWLFWENKKRIITIAILLLLTGGQAITMRSSFNGNFGGGGSPGSSQNNLNPDQDFQKTLNEIENQENLKTQVRTFIENKDKLYSDIALAVAILIVVALIILVLFFLNCYFHLLFINTVKVLDLNQKKNKKSVKQLVGGRWKKLALMRVIFFLVTLGSLIVFLLPAGFFVWQKSWPLAITMGGFSLLAIFVVLIMLSYVFRYSLFYLALGKVSVKESIDCGYELFAKFWKESILTSLVNFALGIIAAITAMFLFLVSAVVLFLIAAFVGLIIYLVAGMAHSWGIAVGVGIVIVLIPLILIGILLASIWQGLVVIFWYYIFNELAGCKLPEPAKEVVLEKAKKPAVKPVVQKEEE